MSGKPLSIVLYDPVTNEEKKKFLRSFVPWKLLKEAVKLQKKFAPFADGKMAEIDEETVDDLANLVISTFGDQFTREELDEGADLGEMITVVEQIVNKAQGINPNPPPAG